MVVFGQKYFYSANSFCIRRSGCDWAKVVLFGQSGSMREKWLYSDKRGYMRAKVVVFGQKWLYSGKPDCIRAKVVVFGKTVSFQAKVVVFRQSASIRNKVVVFGQTGCIQAKIFVFG